MKKWELQRLMASLETVVSYVKSWNLPEMQQKQQKQHQFLRELDVHFLYFIIKSLW